MSAAQEQQRVEALRALREVALATAGAPSEREHNERALDLVAAQIYELLLAPDPVELQRQLKSDLRGYTLLVATLTRLSATALLFHRYRLQVAERKAKMEETLAAAQKGGLTQETIDQIHEQLRLL